MPRLKQQWSLAKERLNFLYVNISETYELAQKILT